MISSVIAKFDCDERTRQQAIRQIAAQPALEVGELIDERNLPCTIETSSCEETEQITRWMLALDGVAIVDVVFVHFEKDDRESDVPSLRNRRNVPNPGSDTDSLTTR